MRVLEDNLPSNCRYDTVEHFGISRNVLTIEECENLIEQVKKLPSEDAGVLIQNKVEVDHEIRDSKITPLEFEASDHYWVFEKIVPHFVALNGKYFNFDVYGFQEPFQFIEYVAPCGHYDNHIDKILKGNVRKLTVVLQLSNPEDYEGGNLQIMAEDGKSYFAPRQRGTVIVFDSRSQHRVLKVTKGLRKSLVGWVVGPRWK